MKTKIFLSILAVMGVLSVTSSCSDRITATEPNSAGLKEAAQLEAQNIILSGTTNVTIPACTVTGTLTDAEIAGLLYMREEEKMARDIYAIMYELYKIPVFGNITKSENIHMQAVIRLLTGFNIPDNSNNNPGEFTNTQLNTRYLQLRDMGKVSLIEALKVGVLIEQTDIADLENQLSLITNSSVKTVYTNLLAASNAHLSAFTRNLIVRGVVYP